MSNQTVTVNRSLVGAIAIVLLAMAGVLLGLGVDGTQGMWAGACLKVGLVVAALWLALPTLTSRSDFGQASWVTVAITMAAVIVIVWKKVPLQVILPTLGAFLFAVRILGPRRSQPGPPSHPKRDF